MGQLREKKINHMRTWIDPSNPAAIPVFDYDIIYPITVYEAIHRTMEDDSTTLDQQLTSIYRLIADKQDAITGGTPGTLMTWSNIKGQIGETEIVRSIGTDQSTRSHQKVPSEKAVGQQLDLKADASAFSDITVILWATPDLVSGLLYLFWKSLSLSASFCSFMKSPIKAAVVFQIGVTRSLRPLPIKRIDDVPSYAITTSCV